MDIRKWLRKRFLEQYEGRDLPVGAGFVIGKDEPTPHALGEYDEKTYPLTLTEQLARREEVAEALLEMDLTDADVRARSIPLLQDLLRRYPHPLAYDALLMAYVDTGRWDEARGVAFAARERRWECVHSPHPEVRAEVERLHDWSLDEIDALRAEREAAPTPTPAPTVVPRPATA